MASRPTAKAPKNTKKIGLIVKVLSDGVGDLGHAISAMEALKAAEHTANIYLQVILPDIATMSESRKNVVAGCLQKYKQRFAGRRLVRIVDGSQYIHGPMDAIICVSTVPLNEPEGR